MRGHSIVIGSDLRLSFVERSFLGFPTKYQTTVVTSRAETSADNIQPSYVCFYHFTLLADGLSLFLL